VVGRQPNAQVSVVQASNSCSENQTKHTRARTHTHTHTHTKHCGQKLEILNGKFNGT